jgi:DnaK suppressor protein
VDAKEKLLARKSQLEAMKQRRQETFRVPLAEMTDELSLYDQHPADIGSELYEREKDYAYLELMEFQLQKLDQALARLEQGVYGICDNCGNAIELPRLERLPETTLCIACARQREAGIKQVSNQDNYDNSPEAMEFGKTFQVAGYELYEE